jgi:seryl-tRNA synthetase
VLDPKWLRDNLDVLRDGLRRRGKLEALAPVVERWELVDRTRRRLIQDVETQKAARNAASQEVARLKRAKEDAESLIARTRSLGDEIARLEGELAEAEAELERLLYEIPNIPLPDVPEGGEERNVVVKQWGTPRATDGVRPHWEVGEQLGLLDLPRGAKLSGSGFIVFRGAGARLVRGMISFMLDLHTREHGYEEVWVPFLVGRAAMTGTGQLPKFEEDMYATRADDLFLVPTAEVPVTNLYAGELLDAARLPMAFVAYTPCFRREAGAAGKDTRGLLRVHQFDKVELVRYSTPEDNLAQHELLTGHAETVLERLGLPYRRVLIAGEELGFSNAKQFDLETWAPGVGKWLEVSSCSTYTDYQARRANIRYRPAPGERPRLVHTLNGSALAFPRIIATMLEHYQRADGAVDVPEALRPYVGCDALA